MFTIMCTPLYSLPVFYKQVQSASKDSTPCATFSGRRDAPPSQGPKQPGAEAVFLEPDDECATIKVEVADPSSPVAKSASERFDLCSPLFVLTTTHDLDFPNSCPMMMQIAYNKEMHDGLIFVHLRGDGSDPHEEWQPLMHGRFHDGVATIELMGLSCAS